jgi:subtilisin
MPWLSVETAREFLKSGTGRGARVAILDSGVEVTHPALGRISLADDLAVIESSGRLEIVAGQRKDLFGHGTAIADIIHRVAPEAEIGSFRVLGQQLQSRTAIISEGVRQALDRGYHILNCSFGCGRLDQVLQYKDWIDEAYIRDRHIVAACNNHDFGKREWPGHFPTVVTVNFADSVDAEALYYRSGTLVEFAARGQEVEVAWLGGGIKKVTGSSFAVPHVAGLLARMVSRCPGIPPLEAKALLRQLAAPILNQGC